MVLIGEGNLRGRVGRFEAQVADSGFMEICVAHLLYVKPIGKVAACLQKSGQEKRNLFSREARGFLLT